jgi:hypothetical protein
LTSTITSQVTATKNVGACLLANEPEGLGNKMIQRRIEGKSWKEIADEFQLGSPSTARAQFKKLTGISDFKSKGHALKQLLESGQDFAEASTKSAAKAVKKVDDAAQPLKETVTKPAVSKEKFNVQAANDKYKTALDDFRAQYGKETTSDVLEMLSQNKGYAEIVSKTNVPASDLDNLYWKRLVAKNDGEVWNAYKMKPSSESGFKAVKDMVSEARINGLTVKEVSAATDVPEGVIDAIAKGEWKIAGPGVKAPVIPPPPAAAPVTLEGPASPSGRIFKHRERSKYNQWGDDLGRDLNDRERQSIKTYTGSGYRTINSALRGGKRNVNSRILETTMRPIPFDTMVTRHCGETAFRNMGVSSREDFATKVLGKTYKDEGFMSTSIKAGGNWSGSVEMRISVPKGTPCRWVDNGLTSCPGENELIIQRGQTMLITRVETGAGGRGGFQGRTVIWAEII